MASQSDMWNVCVHLSLQVCNMWHVNFEWFIVMLVWQKMFKERRRKNRSAVCFSTCGSGLQNFVASRGLIRYWCLIPFCLHQCDASILVCGVNQQEGRTILGINYVGKKYLSFSLTCNFPISKYIFKPFFKSGKKVLLPFSFAEIAGLFSEVEAVI